MKSSLKRVNVVGVFDLHAREASKCQKSLSEKQPKSRKNVKGDLDCFNCKTGVFPQIIHVNVCERKQLQYPRFCEKSQFTHGEYLTIIKKN